jgi:hypothetical protein
MCPQLIPPELAQHLVTATVSAAGVSFDSPDLNRRHIPVFHQYFVDLRLDKTYYGKYYIVCHDGIDDGLYAALAPLELPLLTICKRAGQEGVYLLPMPSLLDPTACAMLQALREKDVAFLSKRPRVVWYGGLSGPLPPEENVRCKFVAGAPAILDRIGVPHDIKFTHLFGRANLYQPRFGRYEPEFIQPQQQLGERFLVALDGNGYPSNLHWALGVNSLVLRNDSRWRCTLDEFFFPGHDYISFASDLSDLEERVRYVVGHESEMEQLVVNSTLKMRAVTRDLIDTTTRATLRQIHDRN